MRFMLMASITLAYFVAGKIGLGFASVHVSASPVWVPAGMAVALFLLLGFSLWPAIFAGAFLVNATTAGSLFTSASIAVGNTLEGVLGAWLLQRYAHGVRAFDTPVDVFKFAALTGLLSPLVSATIGVTTLTLSGFALPEQYGSIWSTWWLGDAAGILIVAPALVLWSEHPRVNWQSAQRLELVLLVLVLLTTCEMIFGVSTINNHPLQFLLVPPLIWAAFRFGPRETVTLSVLLAGWAAWGTMNGRGPFARPSENDALLLGQAFLGLNTVMALALAAGVRERIRAEARARESTAQRNRFAAIVESSDDAIISKTPDGTIVTWNKGAERLFGYTQAEVVGQSITILLPPALDDEQQILNRISAGERIDHYETQRLHKNGSIIDVSLTVSPVKEDGHVIGASTIMRDITERKQAEKQRVRLLSREWAAREEAETLLEISKTIAAELDIETLLQKITDASTSLSGAEFGAFFYNVVNAKGESYMLYALSGASREEFQKLGLPRNTPLFEPTFSGTGVVRLDDVLKDSRYGTMAPHYGMPKGHLPVRSYLAVPVKSRSGEVLGGLFFGHSESGVFTERAERCVLGIAAQAAIAIDNARMFSGFQAEIVQRKQAEESL